MLENVSKTDVFTKSVKIDISREVLQKRVFRGSKSEPKMMPKECKKIVTEGKTRIGKQAFRIGVLRKRRFRVERKLPNL